jgi:CubicO group peptidase (beta-lactamase class C family)
MDRRVFLINSGRAALGFCSLPLAGCVQGVRPSAGRKVSAHAETLITFLEKLIPQLMEHNRVPGVSIALIKDGNLFWRRGFGVKDRESRTPVDNDTVFEAASVSKTVFAYAALKLCERGVIGLDTPLTKYTVKPFLEDDVRLELITARRVLSHTTGFADWRSNAEPLKIHFTPGERYAYSGEGYFYLQSVMSQLAGHVSATDSARYEAGLEVFATDISDYLRANLLEPFGMTSSGYVWRDTFEQHAAKPHDVEGKPLTKAKPKPTDAARYAAAGGLHTTPTDYARFLVEVINPKESDAFRLSAASLKEMIRPQVKVDDSHSWALGWEIYHGPKGDLIMHGGNQKGFHAFAVASVERKSGVVIMTNGDNGWKLNAHIVEQIVELYL